jgi:hypothetical protein
MSEISSTSNNPTEWFGIVYQILDASFGISKFNQAVPLLISGVAVGVSLVNRNFVKCLGHLIGGMVVIFVTVIYILNNQSSCKQFTTAFLWYTVAYIMFCMQASDRIDSNTLIGIVLSFIILVFVDVVTFLGSSDCVGMGFKTYIILLLLGLTGGIGMFYIIKLNWGNGALYDFGGCSCDNCNGGNCSVGCAKTFMAKQVSSQ